MKRRCAIISCSQNINYINSRSQKTSYCPCSSQQTNNYVQHAGNNIIPGLINDPCIQNPCIQFVVMLRHGEGRGGGGLGSLCCYVHVKMMSNSKCFASHHTRQNSWMLFRLCVLNSQVV